MLQPAVDWPASPEPSVPQRAVAVAAANSQSDTPSTRGLVIRVKIISKGPPRAPVRRRLSRAALLLILGVVAVLSGIGISVFRAQPTSAPAATEEAPNLESQSPAPVPAPSEASPVVSDEALPISQVIPDVPKSARDTIRGTVRVSARVILDKEGTVLVATAHDAGPSRYFERLAIEAAKKWTFAPTDSDEQRIMLVRFNFTRAGTTARASSLQ